MAKTPKRCDCLNQVNEQLADSGVRLQTCLEMDFGKGEASIRGPLLAVEWIGKKRRKLPTVMCSFCPICGRKNV